MNVARTSDQICEEINAVTKKAEHHQKKTNDFWDTRKALVVELKRDFPDIWLDELKERCQIGRSQAFKIAAIADGRTTEVKEREKNTEANRRYRRPPQAETVRDDSIPPSATSVHHDGLPVLIDAPKPPEEEPREIVIRLSRKAPQTAEEVAADAMLLVGAVLRQYDVDQQQARGELIRLLAKDNEPIAPGTPAMPYRR
jgi:hypothetical protein